MDITAKYSRNDFLSFLSNSFLPDDFVKTTNELIMPDKTNFCIENAVKLGTCPSLDLSVYEFLHTGTHDPRIKLSHEAFSLLARYDNTASNALAVFYNKDSVNWRLSLITSEYSAGKKKGQVTRGFSNPRRFSWLLGKDCKRHTPEAMLFAKGKVTSLEDLSSRFAIDVVTRKFYRELFDWYDKWAVNVVKFPTGEGTAARLPKQPDAEANRQRLIRLITRLIFVWFLKQKDNLIPEWIFNKDAIGNVLKTFDPYSDKEGNYYNGIIQNLFFATLNKEITERAFTNEAKSREHYGIKTVYRDHKDNPLFKISPDEFVKKFETVPFLNGGLFECLDRREGYEKQKYVDGFSREKNRAAFVPNSLFFGNGEKEDSPSHREGIIDLFNRYNFTVEENTPQDIDIALDPELLGKVFENLLGTYNAETQSTARKESGSFYTPREIVDYMVDASLKEYLKGKLSANNPASELEERLDKLFSYHEITHNFSPDEVEMLMCAIQQCTILDPACGSGAFPMGVLNKLTFIMGKLDPDNKLWKEIQIQKAKEETEEAYRSEDKEQRDERIREISDVFELSTGKYSNYARKLFLIENCIFGIDIQPIAIQISKLRFFISLIVDQKTGGDKENNYNVLPLPNLETKFVAANTLIGLEKNNADTFDFTNPEIAKKQKELLDIRHRHFSAGKAAQKTTLRKRDKVLCDELANLLEKENIFSHEASIQLANWNPYDQTKAVDFFDLYWMFGIKDGFDVVIGNPPYVRADNPAIAEQRNKISNSNQYKTLWEKWDLMVPFFERGLNTAKAGGFVIYIASDAITTSKYAEKLQNWIIENHFVKSIDYFENINVFEAGVTPVILFLRSTKKDHYTFKIYRKNTFNNTETVKIDCSEISRNKIFRKTFSDIFTVKVPRERLGDICYISYGLRPNSDEKTAKGEFAKDDLISNIKDKIHCKEYIEGKDISAYQIDRIRYLEYNTKRVPEKLVRPTFEELYTGDKILRGRVTKGTFDNTGIICNDSIIVFKRFYDLMGVNERSISVSISKNNFENKGGKTSKQVQEHRRKLEKISKDYNLKYILAIINSKYAMAYLNNYRRHRLENYFYPDDFRNFLIPKIDLKHQKTFVVLVDQILTTKAANPKADTSALEREIDNLVYKLYNLTCEEVKVIEPEFVMNRAEWEKIILEEDSNDCRRKNDITTFIPE